MSNETKALSISFRSDDGCIEHNNRDFFTDNVDKSRSPNNITYVKRDLRELYHELFDEALAEYNARQNRHDRQIPDYFEHIRKSKKEKLFQEIIVMFGNSENCGVGSEKWETAKIMLEEYMRDFEKRNPNLKVFNAVMHLDEATPHLHIDFVPVCCGQKQGLSTRVSMKRAIQQMGFSASGKKETEAILWGSSERAKLTEILNNHNIVRQVVGAFHDHKSVEEYKRYAQLIDSKNAHINALKKEKPVDLSSTDVGDILNQNDFLRDTVTMKNKEISQLKAMTKSPFVPIEIYNDEKRQYIIELLQRVNCHFVEEINSIYIPEYYEPSVKKALAAFKPMNEQTYSERLKFFIDRLIYSATDFEHFIKLLEANNYEVRRGKYIAVKPPYAKRPFRLKSLGADYSENALKKRIEGRHKIPDSFLQDEYAASKIEKPFYSTINASITLVRKFEITPKKWDTKEPYDFMNDLTIGRLLYCLNTISEQNIRSREQLYEIAAELRAKAENNADDLDLKTQLSQIENVIRTYEEIVEGNYIDNLIKAEHERREAELKKENSPEQPTQTVNRKQHKR